MRGAAPPAFRWRGVDGAGRRCRGELRAADPGSARVLLYRRGIHVVSLRRRLLRSPPALSEDRSIALLQQLSAVVEGGLSLLSALDILQRSAERPAVRRLLREMRAEIAEGAPLSQVMARRPRCFAPADSRLLAVGERTGLLGPMLRRACEQRRERRVLRRRLRQALMYPATVALFAVALGALLLLGVTPRFAAAFADFGVELPALTRAVIALSAALAAHAQLLFGALALIAAAVFLAQRLPGAAPLRERLLRRLPLFGALQQRAALAHFFGLCAVALEAGAPLTEALEIAADSGDSAALRAEAQSLRAGLLRGTALSAGLAQSRRFPPLARGMTAAGEQSGRLAQTLEFLGRHYGEEQEALRARLAALLEPTLIALLGLLLGGFVLAMYLPVFQLGAIL